MSYLKFSSNLFLEKQELEKFKTFLDDEGFRNFLLKNSSSFGWIKIAGTDFTNGLAQEDTGFTVKINPATLIDSSGNLIYSPQVNNLAIPISLTNWYWIKITHAYSSQEVGTYSIDSLGNLTCTSSNGSFSSLLRGQPNYPSRVKFLNASLNTLSYDVEEVIDDNNAVLTGSFTAETGLTLSVVGTFTPGYVPTTDEQNIFQYDSSTISLVLSNTSTPPTFVEGVEFFIARVKNTGSAILIEDKRDSIWLTTADYKLSNVDVNGNPLIGVEQITFDDQFTPRDRNVLQIAWGLSATAYSVDLKLNKITVTAGHGGTFKASTFSTDFNDGDFDGWRLYTDNGNYFKVVSSLRNGSTIDLYCDYLSATSFFSDVNSTTAITQTLLIVPEAEEIEIVCTPSADVSDPADTNGIVETRQSFPINELYGRVKLIVYDETDATYTISYRYKNFLGYTQEFIIPDDSVGYYNENQFNVHGYLTGSTQTSYGSGLITLIQSSAAYSNVVSGDVGGVEYVAMTNSDPLIDLEAGVSKQNQVFINNITLTADYFINLKSSIKNGNTFYLYFASKVTLDGNLLQIRQDSTGLSDGVLLKSFSQDELNQQSSSSSSGTRFYDNLAIKAVWDGSYWELSLINSKPEEWHIVGATDEPAFENSWLVGNAIPAVASFGFRRDGNRVYLQGIYTKASTTIDSIFTLPPRYRPSASKTFSVLSSGLGTVTVGIRIDTDGKVYNLDSGVANPFYRVDGVIFSID